MSELLVKPSSLEGEVEAPPSKSYTHRALTAALLAEGESNIEKPLLSLDTRATIGAVNTLGGAVEYSGDSLEVTGTGGKINPKSRVIDVRNSGTTIRFMSAISALSPFRVRLTGDESILKRPMGPLVDSLVDLGADAEAEGPSGRPPVLVGGGLEGGDTTITGSISSQFISALLFASPYSEVGADIEIEGEQKSKPYVHMTLRILDLVGAEIKVRDSLMRYTIPGEQVFDPLDFRVPGDFSSSAFLLAAGVLTGGKVSVINLDHREVQGDKKILNFLNDFGAEIKVRDNVVEVEGSDGLQGIDADCMDTPDLVPVVAVLGAVSQGQTRIYNVSHLRYKEVDRLRALSNELGKLGVRVEESEEELKIFGNRKLKGGKLNSYGDHRMAMALAVAGLVADNPVRIEGAESIDISYPNFVEDMKKLGAHIETFD